MRKARVKVEIILLNENAKFWGGRGRKKKSCSTLNRGKWTHHQVLNL